MKTKLAIYTSTRAEFGLLRPLISKLKGHAHLEVRLFVTGTHLSHDFGYTITEIEAEFKDLIYYRVQHGTTENSRMKNLDIMSEALFKYAEALATNRPDLTLILGDRYEAFCYGVAASSLSVPIIHIHGGEITAGAIDDKFRHCLTKLSDWHFVACHQYKQRVIQLGEEPARVFNTGALGVDNALNLIPLSRNELQHELKFEIPEEFYLFTFHPETNSADCGVAILREFLKKLEGRLSGRDAVVLLTGVNSDAGSTVIRQVMNEFIQKAGRQAFFIESLGVVKFLSLMKLATAVVGNSSSGVLEAFSMRTPTINLGRRQEGRQRESSVLDFPDEESLNRLNFDQIMDLKQSMRHKSEISIFGAGAASSEMSEIIGQLVRNLPAHNTFKTFHDLGV